MNESAEPESGANVGRAVVGNRPQLLEEAHRLSEMRLEPAAYFRELLPRLLHGANARGGSVWSCADHGALRCEATAGAVDEIAPPAQQALLEYIVRNRKPLLLPPGGSVSDATAANPTSAVLVLVPVLVEQAVVGIHHIHRDPAATPSLGEVLPFLVAMAHHASIFQRNCRLRVLGQQQELWLRLEAFGRKLHTLDFQRVAYVLANDGRHLVGGDRLSVLEKRGRRARLAAVSGADVIAARSRQMTLLAQLGHAVLAWGETLDFQGVPDDRLPAAVIAALDAYLESTACSRLIVLPLRDSDEEDARFALVLESFESSPETSSARQRLETVGHHARSALDNAAAHHAVPLRRVWSALAAWNETPVRSFFSVMGVAAALAAFVLAATFLDYPLRLQAEGRILPCIRRSLFSPVDARVVRFEPGIRSGEAVVAGQPLALMYDLQLELKQIHLEHEIAGLQEEALMLATQQAAAHSESERAGCAADKKQKEMLRDRKLAELRILAERHHADETRPGHFWLTAPLAGTVFSLDFRESLTGRTVRPSEPLLRIGDRSGGWEVELHLPQQEVGPILEAFERDARDLDVDLRLTSMPTRFFRGKLPRDRLGHEAVADREERPNAVRAFVRIDGNDIPETERVPLASLFAGAEVHARVCCGRRPILRALFHDVWNFVHEKALLY